MILQIFGIVVLIAGLILIVLFGTGVVRFGRRRERRDFSPPFLQSMTSPPPSLRERVLGNEEDMNRPLLQQMEEEGRRPRRPSQS